LAADDAYCGNSETAENAKVNKEEMEPQFGDPILMGSRFFHVA